MFSIPVTPVYMAEQDRTRSAEAVIRHPSNESRARLSQDSQHTGIFSFNPSKGDTGLVSRSHGD